MKKRLICLILCLAVLAGVLPGGAMAEEITIPGDPAVTHWYDGYVKYTMDQGLFYGGVGGSFQPGRDLTRGEFVTVLSRLHEKYTGAKVTASGAQQPFSDVADGRYYAAAVAWASENGIVYGYPDGSFRPNASIDRESLAAMTLRYLDYAKAYLTEVDDPVSEKRGETSVQIEDYNDMALISGWAREAVAELTRIGALVGSIRSLGKDENGKEITLRDFRPKAPITRAEAAAVLARLHASITKATTGENAARLLSAAATPRYIGKWERNREADLLSDETREAVRDFSYRTSAAVLKGTKESGSFSPLSLYQALAILASGAEEQTKDELLALLGQNRASLADETGRLYRLNYEDSDRVTLQIANSLWLDNTGRTEFKKNWVRNASLNYYADVYEADFRDNKAAELLGQWISDHTGGMLHPLPEEIGFDPETVIAIVNTLYYKAVWTDSFSEENTKADTFITESGKRVTADFMHRTDKGSTCRVTDQYTTASLGLASGKITFVLPEEHVAVDDLLDADKLKEIFEGYAGAQFADVVWSIPKFESEATYPLKETLQALGIENSFSPVKADFSNIADAGPNGSLYVSDVKQSSHIVLNEDGVEAAAYTEVLMNDPTSAAPMDFPTVKMDLNRPFLYLITAQNNTPLFIGVVRDPNA